MLFSVADWRNIEQAAAAFSNKKWISNEKQKSKLSNEPHGHNFEAVAHFKEYAYKRYPYYVYTIHEMRGNPTKPSFVIKLSKLKASFALKMDQKNENKH